MAKHYNTEREGQIEFFDNYGIDWRQDDEILVNNTDGIFNGNILEFKLNINNLNAVLFQAIKYLSRMRIKGESIPAKIILVDLCKQIAYIYNSIDYIKYIHQVYIGAASKNNTNFTRESECVELHYSELLDSSNLKKILKATKPINEMYIPIDIDENCIVGWAERYYREKPDAKKGDFLGDEGGTQVKIKGEIRNPRHFKYLINPYIGRTNEKFKYLMDCLNDKLNKKDLGAFYTPMPYAKKSAEMVLEAVNKALKKGKKDYIILDRCAGTGNLETALIGLCDSNGDDLISHCIVSTYEYYEYKVLNERIGDKVRDIVPPTEADVVYDSGKVSNADAMSKEFIENPIISKYVNDKDCAIILFENPPYSDSSSSTFIEGNDITKKGKSMRKESYVTKCFKNDIKAFNTYQSSSRELSNLFIWSGFKFYLRQETDAYIVYSPVKYFKSIGLVKKKMIDGYAFNRGFFHATESVISCIYWSNIDSKDNSWKLKIFDINEYNKIEDLHKNLTIEACYFPPSKYADLRKFIDDVPSNVVCGSNGIPIPNFIYKKGRKPIYNENIIAYMTAINFPINAINYRLTRCNTKSELEQSFGFHLRRDNYLEKLPIWTAKLFPQIKWFERDVYFTTADGGYKYLKDKQLIKSCLIFVCLSNQNKCLSFVGSDNRLYKNELCFDSDTIASKELNKMVLNKTEEELIKLWSVILDEAKQTKNYNSKFKYGVFQIVNDLNTFKITGIGKNKKIDYDYPKLNGDLETLRSKLKEYYINYISEKMFKYQLVK